MGDSETYNTKHLVLVKDNYINRTQEIFLHNSKQIIFYKGLNKTESSKNKLAGCAQPVFEGMCF